MTRAYTAVTMCMTILASGCCSYRVNVATHRPAVMDVYFDGQLKGRTGADGKAEVTSERMSIFSEPMLEIRHDEYAASRKLSYGGSIQNGVVYCNVTFNVPDRYSAPLAYDAAKAKGTIESLEQFLREYPNVNQTAEAGYALEGMLFDRAKKDGTPERFEEYLRRYPQGRFSDEASSRVEAICFDRVKREGTQQGFADYLRRYPQGRFSTEVTALAEEAAYSDAEKAGTSAAALSFLSKYSAGTRADDIRRKLPALMLSEGKKADNIAMIEDLISRFPDSKEAEEGRAIQTEAYRTLRTSLPQYTAYCVRGFALAMADVQKKQPGGLKLVVTKEYPVRIQFKDGQAEGKFDVRKTVDSLDVGLSLAVGTVGKMVYAMGVNQYLGSPGGPLVPISNCGIKEGSFSVAGVFTIKGFKIAFISGGCVLEGYDVEPQFEEGTSVRIGQNRFRHSDGLWEEWQQGKQ